MERREFLKLSAAALSSWSLSACSRTSNGRPIPFGLGEDPEKLYNGYDPAGRAVFEVLQPEILCMWLNGGMSQAGPHSPSMAYVREWAQKGRFAEWSRAGFDLLVITWENYDGQNPLLGPPSRGEYHISEQFLEDLRELVSLLESQYRRRLLFALATEQSTFSACRYTPTCPENPLPYSDRVDERTEEYFSQLRENLLRAVRLLGRSKLNAAFGPCFGGWLVEFPVGRDFISYFEPVIEESNALFFQSMMDFTSDENNGYGNPERILANLRFFRRYGKPVHLAHYMPNNKRADVVAEDLARMSEEGYLSTLRALGLASFSFMEYGILKDDVHGALDTTRRFRSLLAAPPA